MNPSPSKESTTLTITAEPVQIKKGDIYRGEKTWIVWSVIHNDDSDDITFRRVSKCKFIRFFQILYYKIRYKNDTK